MPRNPVLALLAYLTAGLRPRVDELRANPDRGSHAVEYAIGIGLGAAVIIGLYGAYRSGVATIIRNWVFR